MEHGQIIDLMQGYDGKFYSDDHHPKLYHERVFPEVEHFLIQNRKPMKKKGTFKLVRLNKVDSSEIINATCEPIESTEGRFYAEVKGSNEAKEAMWNFFKDDKDEKICEVEYEGFKPSGRPLNPVVVSIQYV